VCNGYEREFVYVYGAVSPVEGQLDTMITREMNRVFSDLASVIDQLEAGLPRLASNRKGLQSLTAWPWIIGLNWNAI